MAYIIPRRGRYPCRRGLPCWAKEFARFSGRDYEDLPSVMEIPLGKIVCIANLVDCQRTENVRGKLSTL